MTHVTARILATVPMSSNDFKLGIADRFAHTLIILSMDKHTLWQLASTGALLFSSSLYRPAVILSQQPMLMNASILAHRRSPALWVGIRT